jgi:hypothetical protein
VALGYAFAAVFGAALVVFAIVFYKPVKRPDKPVATPVTPVAPVQPSQKKSPTVAPTVSTDIGWILNLTNLTIPSWTVRGRIRGTEFKFDHAMVGTNVLILRENTNTTDMSVVLFLNQKPGESLSGKRFAVSPDSEPILRYVSVAWWDEQDERQQQRFTNGYALKLEFGNVTRNKITGTNMLAGAIYLCLPDTNRSYLAGTFDARILAPRPPDAPPREKKTKRTKKR